MKLSKELDSNNEFHDCFRQDAKRLILAARAMEDELDLLRRQAHVHDTAYRESVFHRAELSDELDVCSQSRDHHREQQGRLEDMLEAERAERAAIKSERDAYRALIKSIKTICQDAMKGIDVEAERRADCAGKLNIDDRSWCSGWAAFADEIMQHLTRAQL